MPSLRLLYEIAAAALQGTLPPDLGFLYLTHNYLDLSTGHTWDSYGSPVLWREIFGTQLAVLLSFMVCMEYFQRRPIVSRAALPFRVATPAGGALFPAVCF